jgi:hypothetical protein
MQSAGRPHAASAGPGGPSAGATAMGASPPASPPPESRSMSPPASPGCGRRCGAGALTRAWAGFPRRWPMWAWVCVYGMGVGFAGRSVRWRMARGPSSARVDESRRAVGARFSGPAPGPPPARFRGARGAAGDALRAARGRSPQRGARAPTAVAALAAQGVPGGTRVAPSRGAAARGGLGALAGGDGRAPERGSLPAWGGGRGRWSSGGRAGGDGPVRPCACETAGSPGPRGDAHAQSGPRHTPTPTRPPARTAPNRETALAKLCTWLAGAGPYAATACVWIGGGG